MYLLLLGIVLLVLKYLELGPVADLDWWWVLLPFPLTAIWWWIADASGYSRRKSLEKEELRRQKRLEDSRKRLSATHRSK